MGLVEGKIYFHYVGEYGRHTEIVINNKLVECYFFTNTSIMLLLWCACDMLSLDIQEVLTGNHERVEDEMTNNILGRMSDRSLLSKYDILYNKNAVVEAYLFIKGLGLENPIGSLLDIHDKLINNIRVKYKVTNLEVIYECNKDEIFQGSRFQ